MKKSIMILLVFILVVSLIAGCSNNQTSSSDSAVKNDDKVGASDSPQQDNKSQKSGKVDEVTFPIVPEKISVSMMRSIDPSVEPPLLTGLWFERMEEKTNIHIECIDIPSSAWAEKRNLALVSGDYSDIFYGMGTFSLSDEAKYGSQGIFIPLNKLIEEKAPTFRNIMAESELIRKSITHLDGNIYVLPYLGRSSATSEFGETFTEIPYFSINAKWIENLGLDAPTTVEGLYNVFKAFKEQDPNGNGIQDEIPFLCWGLNSSSFKEALTWFGVFAGIAEDNGIVYYGQATEEYKEFLAFMKKLYDEQLFYNDSITLTAQQAQALAQGSDVNIAGAFYDSAAFILIGQDTDKYLEYASISPVVAKNGNQMTRGRIGVTTGTFVISDKCQYPEEMIQWIDWQYTEEGGSLQHLGVEGENYKIDSSTGAYERIIPEGYTNAEVVYNGPCVIYPLIWNITTDPFNSFNFANRYGVLNEYATAPMPKIMLSEDQVTQNATILTDIEKYVNEFTVGVITGTINLDSEWDNYIETLRKMGLDRLISSNQEAVDKYYKN